MDTKEEARPSDEDGFYTAFITLKNGRKLFASAYGLKAFFIRKSRRKKDKKGED